MKPRYYIALETSVRDESLLQCLSAKIMQVQDDIWLIDLSPFLGFWVQKARTAQMSLLMIWKKSLHVAFNVGAENPLPTLQADYRAALATHPWCALLLLNQMRERNISGLLQVDQGFGKELWLGMSWETWWSSLDLLGDMYERVRFFRFKLTNYKRHVVLFKRSIRRLQLSAVSDLKKLSYPAMRRRFGDCLAEVWQWTTQTEQNSQQLFGDLSFPWQNYEFRPLVQVQRHLEYGLTHWEQIEALLLEDLDRLAQQQLASLRVSKMQWVICFESLQEVSLNLEFRHPYHLSQFLGQQKAALLQAQYAFHAYAATLLPESLRRRLDDASLQLPLVMSWKLIIEEHLYVSAKMYDLFGGLESEGVQLEEQLDQLCNELPIPLQRYQLFTCWSPEHSYRVADDETYTPSVEFSEFFTCNGATKPLYVYQQPRKVGNPLNDHGSFVECVMSRWWEKPSSYERAYYKLWQHQAWRWFYYCHESKEWYEHGIFN